MNELLEKFNSLEKKDKIKIGVIVGAAGVVLITGGFLLGRRAGIHKGIDITLSVFERALAEIEAIKLIDKATS